MADAGKLRISSKQIVEHIRSGKEDAWLRQEYGLSEKGLESVYKKLVDAGALSRAEITTRNASGTSHADASPDEQRIQETRCPSCNAAMPSQADECPVCGIVVAKFVPGLIDVDPVRIDQDSDSHEFGRWAFIGLSVLVMAVLGVGLIFWSTHQAKEMPKIVAPDTSEAVAEEERTDSSEGVPGQEDPVEIESDNATPVGEIREGITETGPLESEQETREEIKEQGSGSRQPVAALPAPPPSAKSEYVTGELRRFTSSNFKREVVEASRTYPVIFQFYSDT